MMPKSMKKLFERYFKKKVKKFVYARTYGRYIIEFEDGTFRTVNDEWVNKELMGL